jgi:hypothetical protein
MRIPEVEAGLRKSVIPPRRGIIAVPNSAPDIHSR